MTETVDSQVTDGIEEVESAEELRQLIGNPNSRAASKERATLAPLDRQFLAASPFCLVATADAEGNCDVSPKGDPAGFTVVLDDSTIAIPERPGNKRADGFHNILSNPHVGLIYLLPGRGDTLRINGRARLVKNAPFFDRMVVKGHRPQFAVLVDIDAIYYHCAKAFMRSKLWRPETWQPDAMPSTAEIVKSVQPYIDESVADLERHYQTEVYSKGLYGTG
ncbi:pyridoxamine 5'-phosphate oxidase family protein [Stackebrandtia nassauensis]|uniref:Pyridoxamine 5'-phosphate oxidase-related FMN-binding protein n=1 Tax=Stackebrandtia nassauensis (strain DSM 44728 / CIP 108903 / NRRL B-16338 / NBRC 102104 / LLR-40K-21) TaxID=446470 RepID=D3QAC5_STANL|nr:pyridoxamine 5'-phosphate oxidase family protein [Stackebrandtia nassauensis]ADD42708.1 pyridoxamine 5'-phosphate oxidase-related FMN- binding protein [Stackebrandtia nassauensis DSM 44728]